ncbi:MAG: 1D-myo-inositol 2-acetamido-2-deoxy-alpha-D-glucopyranoside deacetylase [Chloroflexi bacterium]|nr:1D-myo-inositol 2-acetamido-2-deoxy-alpha-D-glucopyranoside deacetylase [Chloroflexota bacterium]
MAAIPRRLTLMAVHAHPDDEVIGTGGVMAKAVAEGHRVVLVTCTRGELGEIVDPELATEENQRRLGEIRAAELEAAMRHLGVTEWENLGYRDSGMMGDAGNRDARAFWQAPLDDAARRLTWLVRTYRPDVMTTYNDFGGYGHPDHVRAHEVAVAAFERSADPAWYPEQLAIEHGGRGPSETEGGLAPWAPAKLYEQAWPRGLREALTARLEAQGMRSFWSRPTDASAEELAAWEEFVARSTVPDEAVTTRVDVAAFASARFAALRAHRSQIAADNPLIAVGPDAWAGLVGSESFVLRTARVPVNLPETDLFAGLG